MLDGATNIGSGYCDRPSRFCLRLSTQKMIPITMAHTPKTPPTTPPTIAPVSDLEDPDEDALIVSGPEAMVDVAVDAEEAVTVAVTSAPVSVSASAISTVPFDCVDNITRSDTPQEQDAHKKTEISPMGHSSITRDVMRKPTEHERTLADKYFNLHTQCILSYN